MTKKIMHYLPHSYAPFFRALHIAIALLIAGQIINSNFIEAEALNSAGLPALVTWLHAISGLLLLVLGAILLTWMLTQRGIKWYYPWIFFRFDQIERDIHQIVRLRLPAASNGGLAATVQGLGVIALLLVASSGGVWLAAERYFPAYYSDAELILHWNKLLTTFVEIYLYSHGCMGLIHIFLHYKSSSADFYHSGKR
ncbi:MULTISPECIES: cytochrome b/b6 domain-containing protein [Pantoea]|uniref:cytochrome b/b6 domain-containing protein n=1 Tax=Pantoea TaxID=53335 RepID=UPI0025990CAF|nr:MULTISPECIES: cytochrome b/b6 domain-containing protein [Pantoea]